MVFNSYGFIFLFLPIFLPFYWFVPRKWCPALLCAGSAVFFYIGTQGHPEHMLILADLTIFGALGCWMFRQPFLRKRWLLFLWIAIIASPLCYVKLAGLMKAEAPTLPLGLSFYTFQLIALLVYAFKGGLTTTTGVLAGTLLFPKLISGPLVEPKALLSEIAAPKRNSARLDAGIENFILGLACKVVIADHLAGVLGQIRTWGADAVTVPMVWLGMIGYALQLYFDFCGYSRMAVGVGLMLGIKLPDNFNLPYCATSISEFWRRWHITLGQWFKAHVYIPLGGSRRGTLRMVFSTLAVWLLTGLWHGAGWNYIFWGLMMFLLIMGERLIYGAALQRHPVVGHVYVPLLVALSWVFFFNETPAQAEAYFLRLVGVGGNVGNPRDWLDALKWCWPYLALGLSLSTPLPGRLWSKFSGRPVAWVLLFLLFWVCMYFLATAASDPFLYFSF